MKRKIEQEIDQTLNCLNDSSSIQVSPFFIDTVSNQISHMQTRRGIGYRTQKFYPVVILLMAVLNVTVFMTGLGTRQTETEGGSDQISVIASEYGIGQNRLASF